MKNLNSLFNPKRYKLRSEIYSTIKQLDGSSCNHQLYFVSTTQNSAAHTGFDWSWILSLVKMKIHTHIQHLAKGPSANTSTYGKHYMTAEVKLQLPKDCLWCSQFKHYRTAWWTLNLTERWNQINVIKWVTSATKIETSSAYSCEQELQFHFTKNRTQKRDALTNTLRKIKLKNWFSKSMISSFHQ